MHLVVRVAWQRDKVEIFGNYPLADQTHLFVAFVLVQLRDRNTLMTFSALSRELFLCEDMANAARVAVKIRLCVVI